MATEVKNKMLANWEPELIHSAVETDLLYIALFSMEGELLFANQPMSNMLSLPREQRLINPTFEKLRSLPEKENSLIFEGHLTIGDYSNLNTSLQAHVYRKDNQLLIMAREDSGGLQEQNTKLQQLNREINNLQRQLIREKRNLEDTLNQLDEANRDLKKINRQKDKFFSIIAHDLRSPFSSILGFTEILREDINDLSREQIATYADHIYKSSFNTFNLLVNLLEWASLQRDATRFNPEKISFNQLFEEVLSLMKEQAAQKNITIRTKLPGNIEWVADKNMVTSILRNIISNALKFTPREGEVEIAVTRKKNQLEFSVSDTGTGMTKEVSNRLFSGDFNESGFGTENEKGSGLGLSLCKEFVEMHGGEIGVESELNKGTTIRFTLPSNPTLRQ